MKREEKSGKMRGMRPLRHTSWSHLSPITISFALFLGGQKSVAARFLLVILAWGSWPWAGAYFFVPTWGPPYTLWLHPSLSIPCQWGSIWLLLRLVPILFVLYPFSHIHHEFLKFQIFRLFFRGGGDSGVGDDDVLKVIDWVAFYAVAESNLVDWHLFECRFTSYSSESPSSVSPYTTLWKTYFGCS